MTLLRRHQLLRLTANGWSRVLAQIWTDSARACLEHWAAHDLPLVVARQDPEPVDDNVSLGLPTPTCWGRQRVTVRVPRPELRSSAPFPRASDITASLPPSAQAPWRALFRRLEHIGLTAHVYGSFGWQRLTGLTYVRDGSDIDMLLPVNSAATADAAALLLRGTELGDEEHPLRLDGELEFPDGSAVAWREWWEWRDRRQSRDAHAGRETTDKVARGAAQILVKRLHGVALESDPAWAR